MQHRAFLASFSEATREYLAARIHTVTFAGNTAIINEGDQPTSLLINLNGQIALSVSDPDGRSVTLRVVGPNESIGTGSLAAGQPYPFTAYTIGPAKVAMMSKREIDAIFESGNCEFCRWLRSEILRELADVWQQSKVLVVSHSMRRRLAYLLFSSALPDMPRIPLALTQPGIAQAIGTTRETVNRLIAQFATAGILRRGPGGALYVVDHDRLRTAAGC